MPVDQKSTNAPAWLAKVLAKDPDADVWVEFKAHPFMFSRVYEVRDHDGVTEVVYAPGATRPIDEVSRYAIGPDGDAKPVAQPKPKAKAKK